MVVLLDFRFEREWVSAADGLPRCFDHLFIAFVVLTVLAMARLVAETANCEAFAIHFEAAGARAFTG